VISQTPTLSAQEFRNWFEKETSKIAKPLDKEADGLIDEVKKKISQVQDACKTLIKESEREIEKGKSYRRARAAKKLAQLFADTLNNMKFPDQISFKNTEALVKDLKKSMSTIERERNIWFNRISPMFIMTRRKIDMVLSKLFESVGKLDSFISEKYVKAKNITDCFSSADTIVELRSEVERVEKEKNYTESAISSVEREIEGIKQNIHSILQKNEVKELTEINSQARELARKIKHELRYLQKPFIKLQNLYHSGTVSVPTEEIEKITEYLTRPTSTLAKEEHGYPVCKRILQRISESLEQDKLKIKTSRQKKAQDQIDAILKNDALLSLQHECKQIYERRKQLLAHGHIAAYKNEITTLRTTLKELERQKAHLVSKLSNLQDRHEERTDKLEQHIKELEKAVFDITGKNVRLGA
jgi:predicted  nucleic acid-binding Zn-ribbon protein